MRKQLLEEESFANLVREVRKGTRVVTLGGLTSVSAKAFLLNELQHATGKKIAVITDSNATAEEWMFDMVTWRSRPKDAPADLRIENIVNIPAFETGIYSGVSPHAQTLERRALAFWKLAAGNADTVFLPVRSIVAKTINPTEFKKLGFVLERDNDIPLDELMEILAASGYVREDPIFNVGQFSVRGGIVDVWSPDSSLPIRIEFFGDTVDSIREFDPETQLSIAQLKTATIAPMREFAASAEDFRDWALLVDERFDVESFARSIKDRTDFAAEGESFSGWEFLLPLVKPLDGSVFDYLEDFVFVVDEPTVIESVAAKFIEDSRLHYSMLESLGEIGLAPGELLLSGEEVINGLENVSRIELRSLGKSAAVTDSEFALSLGVASETELSSAPLFWFPAIAGSTELEFTSRPTMKFHGKIAELAAALKSHSDESEILIVMNTVGMAERMGDILRDYAIATDRYSITVGNMAGGFEMPSISFFVYSEYDIFGEYHRPESVEQPKQRTKGARKSRLGAFISDFRDLKPGDYVVHVDHGIGQFEGLQTITTQGNDREFMLLVYADDAKLFVPVERLDLVSRYSSGEATSPSMDRLGGIGWQKTKAKAKRAMRDMADELLKLYAERKLVQGYAFSPDAPWQHEFEDAFPYELTVDQAKAIEDVKEDMETPRPMDRLIIGDVGYGKTEVAMRAAFKAVMDGKQVAVLTPTTVLAYQHFETFTKRFAAFPAKIDLLSRFRSTKEQKAVVAAAEGGKVDVVVGTHRILSNDVKLPKLGLVIVDEEQRFGVGHKEKLKQLKKKVDVLTLSATPIPRTLNMSLLGMRDMSVIETPPRDRLAINTQVVQFSESVIRSAIELELARSGQVFLIHNRVETIEAIAALVKKIVPNARIAIGHGQMNENEMEQVMLDFIDFKYDVLVATTIIENGIDIPRANTIIINRSDNYGLSQLYQLRGRVGRSNRRAYAYLLIPSELELTPIARRRLSAIREFSDLGAGFRIAALDLELRGAGNILGGQQSGHLDALGFDLYTKMLERTIAEIRGEEVEDETGVSINLGVDVSIPKDYIVEAAQRLRTYKRIAAAESEEGLMQIRSEIEDRYGKLPASVESLIEYGKLRRLAEVMKIVSVDRTPDGVAAKLSSNAKVSPERLMQAVAGDDRISFSPSGILRFPPDEGDPISTALKMLNAIRV